MGRKKQEEAVLETENLEETVVDEAEAVAEELSADGEEEAVEAKAKPKRRRNRKKPVAQEAAVEEVAEEAAEEEILEAIAEEEVKEEAPKRQRRSRKNTATPEAQVEIATEAMQKSMEEMVKQWNTIKDITSVVSGQLEKVSHIVKPSIQEFVDTQDMVRPQNGKQQFITRFATAASIVAVIFSLVSLSLSQSARQVALNSEATRVANSQIFKTPATPIEAAKPAPNESLAYVPHEAPVKKRVDNFVGPRPKAHPRRK